MTDTGSDAPTARRRTRGSQSFWSAIVGVPALLSVLRLGVEAGGEPQTTLLLVANVDPINLMAAMFTTAARYASAGLVATFAIGGVLLVSVAPRPDTATASRSARPPLLVRPPLFARWTESVPIWFVVASFMLALITWDVLYLPLLLTCAAAAFQGSTGLPEMSRTRIATLLAALLIGYTWLVGPTIRDAAGQGELLVVMLFALPPVLALGIPGPLPRRLVPLLGGVAQTVIVGMLVWTSVPVITTPVLPLTVTRLTGDSAEPATPDRTPSATTPSSDSGATDAAPSADWSGATAPPPAAATTVASSQKAGNDDAGENIRGHVVSVDDVSMVILQERGGVRYVRVDRVESQVLCPSEDELPRYRLWVRGFHVEDSLLQGLGRHVRPVNRLDAHCRSPASG